MIPNNATLKKIIDSGILAPSGDNCQPWQFVIDKSDLELWNKPERDESLYNWGQRASIVSHGALLENMKIAAARLGYTLNYELFPDNDTRLIAKINFTESNEGPNPLEAAITQRTTNRKPYKNEQLTAEVREKILKKDGQFNSLDFRLIEDREKIKAIAKIVGLNEKILLENKNMHDFFFDHITWSEEEDREKKVGFYIKTLELPPPAELAFRIFKHWKIMKILKSAGAANFVAKENAKIYQTGSAIGAILIDSDDPEKYLEAGMMLQRIWLQATHEGLSLQPLTGIVFLAGRLRQAPHALSDIHANLVTTAYKEMQKLIGAENKIISLLFRIGNGGAPTARAGRLSPDIT